MIFPSVCSIVLLLCAVHRSTPLPVPSEINDGPGPTPCELCNLLLPVAKDLIAINQSSLMESIGVKICQTLHLADDAVCVGMINEYTPVLIEVFHHSPLTTHEICGVAFNCVPQADIPALRWNVTFPPRSNRLSVSSSSSSSAPTRSVLHLADLHIDSDYQPGSNANCGRPLCCREGTPKTGESGAGFWGDYRTCDLPPWTTESMLTYIVQNEAQIDWIYFTGDIAPHDVWQQTEKKDLDEISFTTRLLQQTFPTKKIYPCVGNHEAAPPDLFRPDDMSWLYSNLARQWISQFQLDEHTNETILKGGYYTTIVGPGLRLISLNMNYCTANNYWLFINSTDPLGQLQWVIVAISLVERSSNFSLFSSSTGCNMLKIIKRRFTSSAIIPHGCVWFHSVGLIPASSIVINSPLLVSSSHIHTMMNSCSSTMKSTRRDR